jgi:hypothetical protein
MLTKFLVIPKKKNSVIKEAIYKKEKKTFTVISTWDACKFLVDQMPKSKLVDSKKVTKFTTVEFIENSYGNKDKVNFIEEIDDIDKKIIRKQVKSGYLYSLESEHGWKLSKFNYFLNGEFDIQEVPVHQLELFSSEIELIEKRISKEEFERYKNEGITYGEFMEIEDYTEACSPIFNDLTLLSIDDVAIPNFHEKFKLIYEEALKQYNKEYPPRKKLPGKPKKSELQYAVVGERWIKRSWYDLTIYEKFDFDKLEIYPSREYIFGSNSCREFFSLSYDGQEFEFRENYGSNSEEFNLISSDGKRYGFEVLDEEYDEDEDNDD